MLNFAIYHQRLAWPERDPCSKKLALIPSKSKSKLPRNNLGANSFRFQYLWYLKIMRARDREANQSFSKGVVSSKIGNSSPQNFTTSKSTFTGFWAPTQLWKSRALPLRWRVSNHSSSKSSLRSGRSLQMKFPLSYATVMNSSATISSDYIFGDEHLIVIK